MNRVIVIFGTRPEAIKLCPVIQSLRNRGLSTLVCSTGQHGSLLDQALSAFNIAPDISLGAMRNSQSISELSARILSGLDRLLDVDAPDLVIVQGDTTTTLCGALAAFNRGIPVAHVEAGLRSGDMRQPFPEEMNRSLTTKLCSLHFAPTGRAAQSLFSEGVDINTVTVTGNTGIDALLSVVRKLNCGALKPGWNPPSSGKRLIVVSAHRREALGPGIEEICLALAELARRPDVEIVFPVHPNPGVHFPVHRLLERESNVRLITPLDYVSFVHLMTRAHLILTDSGGLQEEAPALGKPVLIMRNKTERPEGIMAGSAQLVGTEHRRIVNSVVKLIEDKATYESMSRAKSPYGDGHASERIAEAITEYLDARAAA